MSSKSYSGASFSEAVTALKEKYHTIAKSITAIGLLFIITFAFELEGQAAYQAIFGATIITACLIAAAYATCFDEASELKDKMHAMLEHEWH